MGSRIEIIGSFAVKHSDTFTVNTRNNFVERIDSAEPNFVFVPTPREFKLSISPQSLRTLAGDLQLITFTGIVNIIPIHPLHVERYYMKCNADSNIQWFWKSGLTQPDNRVDGCATVLLKQYQSYMDDGKNFDVSVTIYPNLSTTPLKEVGRIQYGYKY